MRSFISATACRACTTSYLRNEEHTMKKKWIFVLAPIALVAFIAICGQVVMHLWNWLLPTLFGLHAITFWQALGLLILCRILFGGFGGHHRDRRNKWRNKMNQRWENMSPEERAKLSEGWRGRCGGFQSPAANPTEPA